MRSSVMIGFLILLALCSGACTTGTSGPASGSMEFDSLMLASQLSTAPIADFGMITSKSVHNTTVNTDTADILYSGSSVNAAELIILAPNGLYMRSFDSLTQGIHRVYIFVPPTGSYLHKAEGLGLLEILSIDTSTHTITGRFAVRYRSWYRQSYTWGTGEWKDGGIYEEHGSFSQVVVAWHLSHITATIERTTTHQKVFEFDSWDLRSGDSCKHDLGYDYTHWSDIKGPMTLVLANPEYNHGISRLFLNITATDDRARHSYFCGPTATAECFTFQRLSQNEPSANLNLALVATDPRSILSTTDFYWHSTLQRGWISIHFIAIARDSSSGALYRSEGTLANIPVKYRFPNTVQRVDVSD